MLVRSGGDPEPAVVGHVDDPAWPFARRHDFARENDLITDQRQRNRRARNGDKPVAVAGEKSTALLGQLLQAEPFENVFERQIFAERHEVYFVVDRGDRTGVIDNVDRIVNSGLSRDCRDRQAGWRR